MWRYARISLPFLLLLASCGVRESPGPPPRLQEALDLLPLVRGCQGQYSPDGKVWYHLRLEGCGAGKEGAYGREVAFTLAVEGKVYQGVAFVPAYPTGLGGYAWVYLQGPPDPGTKGPVYAATPLRPRPGELTLTASCPQPGPEGCRAALRPLGPPSPLYRPEALPPSLGSPGEAEALARREGLHLGPRARVSLAAQGGWTLLRVEGRGTYRLGQGVLVDPKGARRPFNGVVYAGVMQVLGGQAAQPLTLAGETLEALAPLGGEGLGLLSEGWLRLLGPGRVRAALLARRGPVEAAPGVEVVGSVAAWHHTPLPLVFRPSEPPGFPRLSPPVRPLLLRWQGPP